MRFSLLSAVCLAATALAVPVVKRQSSTNCGDNYYSTFQIDAALNAGYDYKSSGSTAGDSDYPHEYEDYEGFDFNGVSGPYYEFPIEESGVYDGGSPGADRVIFNGDGEYAGVITHTGASGDDFVGCSGTS